MDDMEGVDDEVAPGDADEGAHFQSKEIECLLRPESCNMMQSQEMAIAEGTSFDSSFQILADMLEGKSGNRIVSPVNAIENPCPHNASDAGLVVEELMVRKSNSSNLEIVGTSNNKERIPTTLDSWQHLHQSASRSGSGSSRGVRDHGHSMLGSWEDVGDTYVNEFLAQKPLNNEHKANLEPSANAENDGDLGNVLSHGSIRTKILSKSGFPEFFVKTTLKDKGMVCRGPPHIAFKERRDLNDTKAVIATALPSDASLKVAGAMMVASNVSPKPVGVPTVTSSASLKLGARTGMPSSGRIGEPRQGSSDHGVNLREWLNVRDHKGKRIDSLYIFRQIVDLVDYYHTQGITLLNLRPSSFKLLQSNQVKYFGPISQKVNLESATDQDIPYLKNYLHRKRPAEEEMFSTGVMSAKKKKFNNNMNVSRRWPLFPSICGLKDETANESDINETSHNDIEKHHTSAGYGTHSKPSNPLVSNTAQQQPTSISEQLEEKWYASPEELSEGVCTISSNIYSLGVLFFELLARFDSEREHAAALSDLCRRILPPKFLSENLKEAGFCLLLLHPEPLARPTTREILQSEVTNGLQEAGAEEMLSSIEQDDSESELLLHFLVSLEEQKQNQESKLVGDIRCLEADIEDVKRRHCLEKPLVDSYLKNVSFHAREDRYFNKQPSSSEAQLPPISGANEMKLMRNFSQLERAYFSMRSQIQISDSDSTTRIDDDLLRDHKNRSLAQQDQDIKKPTDCLGAFFDGLCKYARYSKFEVRGMLRTGEFNNSANVICSLSFNQDEDHFAAAGVSKKIKIFEFNSLFNDSVDVHYPAVEMSNRSKLSCVCWNNYIRNYLASSDHDGVVKLWDANTGQTVSHYIEHEKRAWSVDFSRVHPTKLASGSDDCSVKLWNINEKNRLGTIRNFANVCCVQFSADSSHLLAFGSADYRTYCYDLRNTRAPWCVLAGHGKAVSYVKFLDSGTLVTASTDNTLKLWDLKKTSHTVASTNACSLTFSGHTNEKNFVGLSTAGDYIACGSESNEVYAYHRSLPMPMTSYKFGSIDPVSGKETDDDNGLFVSSVCWRQRSGMVLAANSSGCIKVLQMV